MKENDIIQEELPVIKAPPENGEKDNKEMPPEDKTSDGILVL